MRYWRLFSRAALLCAAVGLTPSHAASAGEGADSIHMTVERLFLLGTENDIALEISRRDEELAAETLREREAARLPDIAVGLKGGFVGQPVVFLRGLSEPTRPETPDWSQNYTVEITQPLYQGGRLKYAVREADLRQESARLRTLDNGASLKLWLLDRYMSLFSLYKQKEVLSRNIEESELRLEDILRLRKEGILTDNDVLRSRLQLTNDKLALSQTENSLALVSQQLDITLGLDETTMIIPDTTLLDKALSPKSYEECLSAAFDKEPAMLLARKETDIALNGIKMAKAERLPRLSLTAGNTLARPVARTMADMYNNSWTIGLNLSYPLSALYKSRPAINRATRSAEISRRREELHEQELRMEIKRAWLDHAEAKRRVEALELSVVQARENYRIVRNRYFNSLAILTDLLDANNVCLEAELELTTARTQVIYTYYELQKSCGEL